MSAVTHGQCPRDASTLELHAVGAGSLAVCGQCHGVWAERADLDQFLAAPAESWKLPIPEASQAGAAHLDDSARCLCGVTMATRERRGVAIDVCPQCEAIWLDGGELAQLLEGKEGKTKRVGRAVLDIVGEIFTWL